MKGVGCGEAFVQAVNTFLYVRHEPVHCDAIFIPGSTHSEHVLRAAAMYNAGMAPYIVPSGRFAIGSDGFAGDSAFPTEWAWMRSLLLEQEIPDNAILKEDQATYTWENALFSRKVTDAAGLKIGRGMLCCLGHHARRALLYYQAAYPDTQWVVCPADLPGFSPEDWYLTAVGRELVLGEVRRLGSQVNDVFAAMLQTEEAT